MKNLHRRKPEIRNKFESRNPNEERVFGRSASRFEQSKFEFLIWFELRISDLAISFTLLASATLQVTSKCVPESAPEDRSEPHRPLSLSRRRTGPTLIDAAISNGRRNRELPRCRERRFEHKNLCCTKP